MTKEILVLRFPPPIASPVTVAVNVPARTELSADNASVLVPLVSTVLKTAVTPLGSGDIARGTLRLKPLTGATAIVVVADDPGVRLTLRGEAESATSGVAPRSRGIKVIARTTTDGFPSETLLATLFGSRGKK